MTTAKDIEQLLRHRLNFKDIKILAEAVGFDLQAPELGIDLRGWQTSIYHPVFDPVVMESKHHGVVLASNTYLSSFTYNLVAAWDYYFDGTVAWKTDPGHPLAKALRMNCKKFFAEQILRRTYNLFGIAILLETLLYEEEIMYPVLAASAGSRQKLTSLPHPSAEELSGIASWMTGLVLHHELGHIVHRKMPDFRSQLLEDFPESARQLTQMWDVHQGSAEEFECDAFAVGMGLRGATTGLSDAEKYRLTILGFAVFAALHALDLSAAATAKDAPAETEDPGRMNIRQTMGGGSYVIGTYPKLQRDRAQAVRLLVEAMAQGEQIDVYAGEGRFNIPATIVEDLERFLPTIIEGTDIRLRGKCEMMARALHGYKEGIEYLVWRSKTYTGPEDGPERNS